MDVFSETYFKVLRIRETSALLQSVRLSNGGGSIFKWVKNVKYQSFPTHIHSAVAVSDLSLRGQLEEELPSLPKNLFHNFFTNVFSDNMH